MLLPNDCINEEEKVQNAFIFQDGCIIGYSVILSADGQVDRIDYFKKCDVGDNMYLHITCTPEEENFEYVLKKAINSILENNKKQFIEMRKHLNKKYLHVAESLRIAKLNEWDF